MPSESEVEFYVAAFWDGYELTQVNASNFPFRRDISDMLGEGFCEIASLE